MKTLIVIDMQNDFVSGPLGTPEARAIVPNVMKKIKEYRSAGAPIIFTRDTHYANYLSTNEGEHLPMEHCLYGSDGWQIVAGLADYNDTFIDKTTFGYRLWDLDEFPVFPADGIEIVGVCTDICVISNALILKAEFPEIDICVDATCCAGVTPETHEAALKVMEMCQIKVRRD